jgi:hypothetical protein
MQLGLRIHALYLQFWCSISAHSRGKTKWQLQPLESLLLYSNAKLDRIFKDDKWGMVTLVNPKRVDR